jgi:hypothetical protein
LAKVEQLLTILGDLASPAVADDHHAEIPAMD